MSIKVVQLEESQEDMCEFPWEQQVVTMEKERYMRFSVVRRKMHAFVFLRTVWLSICICHTGPISRGTQAMDGCEQDRVLYIYRDCLFTERY